MHTLLNPLPPIAQAHCERGRHAARHRSPRRCFRALAAGAVRPCGDPFLRRAALGRAVRVQVPVPRQGLVGRPPARRGGARRLRRTQRRVPPGCCPPRRHPAKWGAREPRGADGTGRPPDARRTRVRAPRAGAAPAQCAGTDLARALRRLSASKFLRQPCPSPSCTTATTWCAAGPRGGEPAGRPADANLPGAQVAVDKPAGITTHPTGGYRKNSAVRALPPPSPPPCPR